MTAKTRIQAGTVVKPRELVTIRSERVRIPDSRMLVHLQFRRFAGCPVCNLHLHSIVQRHEEIVAASIREVVVFHSTAEELLPYAGNLPFAVIADPGKQLYVDFGVESAPRALRATRSFPEPARGPIRLTGGFSDRERRPRGGLQVRLARLRPVVDRRDSWPVQLEKCRLAKLRSAARENVDKKG